MMIKVVVFDLDDTLISEKDFAFSAFRNVSNYLSNLINFNQEYIFETCKKLYELDKTKIFDRLLLQLGINISQELINTLVMLYRNHKPDIKISDSTLNVLMLLKRKGYHLGIITDGYLESQNNKVEALGLNKIVDKIIITDELGKEHWKPHPLSFIMIKEFFGVDYHEIVYIGDNQQKDFIAPSQLNMFSIYFNNIDSVYVNQSTEMNTATYCVNKIEDVVSIIERIE